jgi:serine/threonine-protein phosphatase Stp1
VLTEQEALNHPRRNVITRAVGVDEHLKLDQVDGPLQPDDVFLLVSDGVTTILSDAQLRDVVSGFALEEAADEIVRLCLEGGAPDNLSTILVKVSAA